MANHYHLLASTQQENLSQAMQWFNRESTRELNRQSGRTNQVWSGRFFRSLIASPLYYLHAYKYVHRNPIHAGVVRKVEDYPFSTLPGLLGQTNLLIPVEDSTLFSLGPELCLDWLNCAPPEAHWTTIQKALKKKEFRFSKSRMTDVIRHLEINPL